MSTVETFTFSFFGFFKSSSILGRPVITLAFNLLQIAAIIMFKAVFCKFSIKNIFNKSLFGTAFLMFENLGYTVSVVLGLIILRLKRSRILSLLKETRILSEELQKIQKSPPHSPKFVWWYLSHVLASALYPSLCLLGWHKCLWCTFGAIVIDFHAFMISCLISLIVARKAYLMRNVNRVVRGIAPDRDRLLFRKLSSILNRIYDLAEDFNVCFTEINLISLTTEFVIMVTETLYIVNGFFPMDSLTWMTVYVVNATMRTVYYGKLYREADKTANYLHELFIENDDHQVREEIEIFSLQLLHRRVEFDACGFFKLDFALLNSMIGAVTTYTVILIQFQIAGKTNPPNYSNTSVIIT